MIYFLKQSFLIFITYDIQATCYNTVDSASKPSLAGSILPSQEKANTLFV